MRINRFAIFFLLISFTINAFAWQSGATAISHDLDHDQRRLISSPDEHFDAHSADGQTSPIGFDHDSPAGSGHNGPDDFDQAVHQLLHAAGYAQPCAITLFQPDVAPAGVSHTNIPPFIKAPTAEFRPQFRPPRIAS